MTELSVFLICLGSALVASLLTLSLCYFLIQSRIRTRYEAGLNRAIEQFKADVGPEIEARVKQGVIDGVKSLPSREILRDTTRTIAKTGLDIFGDGLKMATRPRTTKRPGTPLDDD